MLPYNRQISYPTIVSIVTRLNYDKRLHLSSRNKKIRTIHKRFRKVSIDYLKFHQHRTDEESLNAIGVLQVDSVEYIFTWNADLENIEVRCSMRNKIVKDTRWFREAERYFQHFMINSIYPVKQLDLIDCDKWFYNFFNRRIPSLKLKHHEYTEYKNDTISNFPECHKVDKIEFVDLPARDLLDKNISSAKHIVFRASWDKDPWEFNAMGQYYHALKDSDGKFETTIDLSSIDAFLFGFFLIFRSIRVMSHFTGIFDKDKLTKIKLFSKLMAEYGENSSSRFTEIDGRECMLIAQGDCVKIVVFQDYFGVQDGKISFTAIKLPARIETLPKETELEVRLLIEDTMADEILGGNSIQRFRDEYHTRADVTRSEAHEQVLTLSGTLGSLIPVLHLVFRLLPITPPFEMDHRVIRMLIHRSHSVKFMDPERSKKAMEPYLYKSYHTERFTLAATCAPGSTEKVLMTYGHANDICLNILAMAIAMKDNPILGRSVKYQPKEDSCCYGDYGGIPIRRSSE